MCVKDKCVRLFHANHYCVDGQQLALLVPEGGGAPGLQVVKNHHPHSFTHKCVCVRANLSRTKYTKQIASVSTADVNRGGKYRR